MAVAQGAVTGYAQAVGRISCEPYTHQLRVGGSVSLPWVRECYCQSRDSAVTRMPLGSARDASMLTGVWRACESQGVPHTSNMVVLIVVLDGCQSARLEALEAIGF